MLRILAVAALAAACSHTRASSKVGTLDVMSPDIAGDRARFLDVTAQGFELTWVGGYAEFDAPSGKGPCATGLIGGAQQQRIELCPLGGGRWHAGIEVRSVDGPAAGDGFDYSATKLPDGCISVERLGALWSVEIADHSPAAEVIRSHPELIGAAVALRLLPLHHENHITLVAAH